MTPCISQRTTHEWCALTAACTVSERLLAGRARSHGVHMGFQCVACEVRVRSSVFYFKRPIWQFTMTVGSWAKLDRLFTMTAPAGGGYAPAPPYKEVRATDRQFNILKQHAKQYHCSTAVQHQYMYSHTFHNRHCQLNAMALLSNWLSLGLACNTKPRHNLTLQSTV